MARFLAALLMAALVSACQTVPAREGFTKRQIAMLEGAGFSRIDEGYALGLEDRVLFGVDRDELVPEKVGMLSELVMALIEVGLGGAILEGHTDSTGTTLYNKALSERRAQAVKAAFVRGGMDTRRIRVVSYGEADPIASNATGEGRAQNRRVVIVITPSDALRL